jgi:hypothetical protein
MIIQVQCCRRGRKPMFSYSTHFFMNWHAFLTWFTNKHKFKQWVTFKKNMLCALLPLISESVIITSIPCLQILKIYVIPEILTECYWTYQNAERYFANVKNKCTLTERPLWTLMIRRDRQSLSMAGPHLFARKHVCSPSSLYWKYRGKRYKYQMKH